MLIKKIIDSFYQLFGLSIGDLKIYHKINWSVDLLHKIIDSFYGTKVENRDQFYIEIDGLEIEMSSRNL